MVEGLLGCRCWDMCMGEQDNGNGVNGNGSSNGGCGGCGHGLRVSEHDEVG